MCSVVSRDSGLAAEEMGTHATYSVEGRVFQLPMMPALTSTVAVRKLLRSRDADSGIEGGEL
jgi:hypothetical protein